nr:hypothetical protein [uncultured Hyphomonas sp.]
MVEIREETQGKTRDLPISSELKTLLTNAAEECGIDIIRVTSGGQCPKGECTKRTGSTRHDRGMAADLQVKAAGKWLDFTVPEEQKTIVDFVRACARLGATGIGAAVDYMGPHTLHIGYGTRAYWGKRGKSANAPDWLGEAVRAGWRESAADTITTHSKGTEYAQMLDEIPEIDYDSPDEEVETDWQVPGA